MNLILNILKKVPIFQALTEEQHESVITHITMEYFPIQHILLKKGDMGGGMYIIKSGKIKIFTEEKTLAELKEGDFFGEMSLIESQPRMASAETLSECEIFMLKKEDFDSLMSQSTDIAEKVKAAYSARKDQNAKLCSHFI